MRTTVMAFVAVLPILALACFALVQQAGTTVTATAATHVDIGTHATTAVFRT